MGKTNETEKTVARVSLEEYRTARRLAASLPAHELEHKLKARWELGALMAIMTGVCLGIATSLAVVTLLAVAASNAGTYKLIIGGEFLAVFTPTVLILALVFCIRVMLSASSWRAKFPPCRVLQAALYEQCRTGGRARQSEYEVVVKGVKPEDVQSQAS
jgi:hypothetical protein